MIRSRYPLSLGAKRINPGASAIEGGERLNWAAHNLLPRWRQRHASPAIRPTTSAK